MANLTASYYGHSLTAPEQVHVKAGMTFIRMGESFDEVVFWGKIFGFHDDYLICRATIFGRTFTHKYFWSVDKGMSFAELPPDIEPWMKARCKVIFEEFQGVPSYIYELPKADQEEDEVEEEPVDEDNPPPPEQKLTELHRLSVVVREVDHDCTLTPIGALILTGDKKMALNPYFSNLDPHASSKLSSYMHLRDPEIPEVIARFRSTEFTNKGDFLDPIDQDYPKGCWKLRQVSGIRILIRNLLWPGFEFIYDIQGRNFHQGYFGTGIRQTDIVFLM